jgi:molybdenum cofactor cytidylyltransferase
MIFAVIPAAGKSTRMGRPKLALPLGDRTILEHVVRALKQALVEPILVVVGPHVPELAALAKTAGAHVLLLGEETPDMRTTVEKGLCWAEEHLRPKPEDFWLLVPGDHPTLAPEVVSQLIEARAAHADRSIVVPIFQGKRGHPTLLAWKHFPRICALPVDLGINAYLRHQAAETQEIPVASNVLFDLDTPEDYDCLLRVWNR